MSFSAVPPLTFADAPGKDLFTSAVEKEELVLSCDVSRPDGTVQWYKDGAEIHSNADMTIQADGIKRKVTIHSAKLSDTGMYTCRAGDNVLIFKVNIRGKNSVLKWNFKKHLCVQILHFTSFVLKSHQ